MAKTDFLLPRSGGIALFTIYNDSNKMIPHKEKAAFTRPYSVLFPIVELSWKLLKRKKTPLFGGK